MILEMILCSKWLLGTCGIMNTFVPKESRTDVPHTFNVRRLRTYKQFPLWMQRTGPFAEERFVLFFWDWRRSGELAVLSHSLREIAFSTSIPSPAVCFSTALVHSIILGCCESLGLSMGKNQLHAVPAWVTP